MPRLILASSSPRRRELLASIGLEFDAIPSNVPEIHDGTETPEAYVRRLSLAKADEVGHRYPDRWVVGADTIVLLGDEILEKPDGEAGACRMLASIAGKTHIVYTGVTLRRVEDDYSDTRVAASEVTMLPLSEREIAWYAATGEPLDKAGAYAVQGVGAMFIEAINGSYTNVVGLPLSILFQMLGAAGIDPLTKRAG
ncbi:MAG TPA: Maf family protein [Thermoanaerobaculia bacterium]|nr:Maf family protein [Thermoanaerobaculia bacterium]